MRAVGDTTAEGCTPGRYSRAGCNKLVIRAKVARGLLQISAAVGQASAAARSSTTTAARVAVSSRRLRDSDRYATEWLSAFASVPIRSTSASGLPRSSQPNRTASSPSETAIAPCQRGLWSCYPGLLPGRLRRRGRSRSRRGRLRMRSTRTRVGLQLCQDRRGDIDRRGRINHPVGNHQVEILRLGIDANLLDEDLLQTRHLLVAPGIEVVLHLTLLALQLAIAVTQVLFGIGPLVLRHRGAVLLQLVFLCLQCRLLVL